MGTKLNLVMTPFECHNCHRVLGYTSPGEAKRMNTRAHVYCETCRGLPSARTERQQELLDTLFSMRSAGERPTIAGAAKRMGVANSRAQQISTALRVRGDGDLLDDLLGRVAVEDTPAPTPAQAAATPPPAPAVSPMPPPPAPAPQFAAPPAPVGVVATPPTSRPDFGSSLNPSQIDPASTGATME